MKFVKCIDDKIRNQHDLNYAPVLVEGKLYKVLEENDYTYRVGMYEDQVDGWTVAVPKDRFVVATMADAFAEGRFKDGHD